MDSLLTAAIATYGISTLFAEYDGLFGMFHWLNKRGKPFDCNVCLLPYVALAVMLLPETTVFYLAIIGAGVIVARLV